MILSIFSAFPLVLMFLFYGFLLVALIVFIVKRIKDKKNEDFEKRDN